MNRYTAAKAVAEADASDATAALKAQADSERVQWRKEKSEVELYKLNAVDPYSLKAPGFNP